MTDYVLTPNEWEPDPETVARMKADPGPFPMSDEEIRNVLWTLYLKGEKNVDKRICVCGHPATSHTDYARAENLTHRAARADGVKMCTPGSGNCPCQSMRWVLAAEETRVFRHKTAGQGVDHALYQGIASAREKGKSVEWRSDLGCYFCPSGSGLWTQGVALTVLSLDQTGREVTRPTKWNVIVCDTHRVELATAAAAGQVDFGA